MIRFTIEEAILRGWLPANAAPKPKPRPPSSASPPHDLLDAALRPHFGERLVREYVGAVPGRAFRLDLAIPDLRIAIEVDGYANHGKTLGGFKKDRLRQNLLALNHWVVLRYFPAQIYQDIGTVVDQILCATVAQKANP